jgi:hypothetical protein
MFRVLSRKQNLLIKNKRLFIYDLEKSLAKRLKSSEIQLATNVCRVTQPNESIIRFKNKQQYNKKNKIELFALNSR